jgi:putative ABC transport system permease protein
MTRLAWRSMWSHKLRTILTMFAILLGVAMITGTFVITDQMDQGFKTIFDKSAQGTDVVITAKSAFSANYYGPSGTLPASLLDLVKAVPGVGEVAPVVYGSGAVVINGKPVATGGAPTLVYSVTPQRFSQIQYISGAMPAQSGAVAINAKLAGDKHLKVGDAIGLTTEQGLQNVTIVGVFNWADSASVGGATIVQTTLGDAQRWYNQVGRYTSISVAATPGVSADALAARIKAELPTDVTVKTAQQSAADSSKQVSQGFIKVLKLVLLPFGGVAVLVGAFIIFNAFSITVAQRLREFAMLRSLGASRRQVLLSVLGEALALGVVASLLGIGAGIGIAKGINALFKAVGADIPTSGIVLASRTTIVALSVGIGVALVSSLAPALRATRVPPVAALQEGAALPATIISRYSRWIAAGVAALGIASLVYGMIGPGTTTVRLSEMGLGVVLLFVAVAMVAKYVVRPLARAIGWPMARVAGTSGRLARDNAGRNPSRTAATAAALMVGLAVVVFVAVFAQGFKSSFVGAIDRSLNAQFVITAQNQVPIPAAALTAVRFAPGVSDASSITVTQAKISGRSGTASAIGIDPTAFAQMWHFHWLKGGSDASLGRLAGTNVLVEEQAAIKYGLSPGATFTMMASTGQTAKFAVIGEYRDPTLLSGFVMAQPTYDSLFPMSQHDPTLIIAKAIQGDTAQVKASIIGALKAFPTAEVRTKTEYSDYLKKSINQFLLMLYALLAVSVVISIFGIVNTLVLSIYERTREIGMLRAIGTTRRQLRRIVRYESVITSIIGGVLGIVLGVFFAWIVTTRLGAQGITFSVPFGQLVIFLVLAAMVGVLAAVVPARRAARIDILAAIHYE